MEGGIDDVGIGVLFGLDKYRYEFAGLLMHAEHLEAAFGVGPHTISVPRSIVMRMTLMLQSLKTVSTMTHSRRSLPVSALQFPIPA